MSMINLGGVGRAGSRLFNSTSFKEDGEEGRQQSCNLIAKQMSFLSPLGKDIEKAVRLSSKEVSKDAAIAEVNSEDDVSEKSDTRSDSNDDDSDSSIEAALNGEEESEASLYNKILAAQEGREVGAGEEIKKTEEK